MLSRVADSPGLSSSSRWDEQGLLAAAQRLAVRAEPGVEPADVVEHPALAGAVAGRPVQPQRLLAQRQALGVPVPAVLQEAEVGEADALPDLVAEGAEQGEGLPQVGAARPVPAEADEGLGEPDADVGLRGLVVQPLGGLQRDPVHGHLVVRAALLRQEAPSRRRRAARRARRIRPGRRA
ncbi:hypothetical protein GCM10020220_076830 [Nonomuraea rubra]|uniref:hypothetical protein n=1 Tax=Nonomuraea rubra TaxID=46180 RepID=UPI0031EC6365